MTVELYTNTDSGSDFQKVLHNGDIYMTVASFFMILITVSEIHLHNYLILYIYFYLCVYTMLPWQPFMCLDKQNSSITLLYLLDVPSLSHI